MKHRFKFFIIPATLIVVVSACITIAMAVSDVKAEPGSDQDPLVSKSYVDSVVEGYNTRLQQLQVKYDNVQKDKDQMNERMSSQEKLIKELQAQLEALKSDGQGPASQGFATVSVSAGQALYPASGSEILLRSGKASAIKGTSGGLSDTTAAKDLTAGVTVLPNHLLISARDDGRGVNAITDCWLLVRGAYKIEKSTIKPEEKPPENIPPNSTIGTGEVNASSLNVRESANTTSKILDKVKSGEKVTVISKSGEWYRIKTPRGISGWVMGKYIKMK